MEATENVEVSELDSVSIISDKSDENDKICKKSVNADNLYVDVGEQLKNSSDDSYVIVNNGELNDTDTVHEQKIIIVSVATTSNVTTELEKCVQDDYTKEETNHEFTALNDSDQVESTDPCISLDDDNLLDELHSGEFNAKSSVVLTSSERGASVDNDLDEVMEIENNKLEECQEDDQDEELNENHEEELNENHEEELNENHEAELNENHEEELDENHEEDLDQSHEELDQGHEELDQSHEQLGQSHEQLAESHEEELDRAREDNSADDDEPIEIDDDDDEEQEQEQEEENDSEDVDEDSEDEDDSNVEENEQDDDSEDNDGRSVSVSDDSDLELIADKEQEKEISLASPKKKRIFTFRQQLKKRSIRCLTAPKRKRRMHLEQSSVAIKNVAEHPNGNSVCQSFPPLDIRRKSTDKNKEVEEMVQMLPNESGEEIDDDDICFIDDTLMKVNGKYESEEDGTVEHNIKIERIEDNGDLSKLIEDVQKERDSDNNVNDVAKEVIVKEEIQNGKNEDDSANNDFVTANNDFVSANKTTTTPIECTTSVSENVPKTTNSIVAVTQATIQDVKPESSDVEANKAKPNNKRPRSPSPNDNVEPTKRLKTELEQSFVGHNKLLQDYIAKTSNNNIDEISNHIDSLQIEVEELRLMAKTKEQEWNNILHLTKVKEEIILRLKRKKNITEIMSTKVGEVEDYTILEQQPSLSQKITKENRNSLLLSNASNNISQNSYAPPSVATTEAVKSIINRAAMNTSDLAKEKVNAAKMHRNILPKPELSGRSSPNIVNYMTSLAPTNLQHIQQQKVQQQLIEQQQQQILLQQNLQQQKNNAALTELLNGHHQIQIGRQGATKDVRSIIEDFRQRNPERAPRRGRRLKGLNSDGTVSSSRTGPNAEGIFPRQSVESRMSELGLLLTRDGCSRPSSTDSSPGNSNLASNTNNNVSTANANVSFNDALMQYAKMNERLNTPSDILSNTPGLKQQTGYPEVTLHPVNSQSNTSLHQSDSSQTNSLLHGILTKNTRPSSSAYNFSSPTLARLLTAPERITSLPNTYRIPTAQSTPLVQPKSSGINLTKPRNEITITPVMSNPNTNIHQTILQQQILQRHHDTRMKHSIIDDEADDSADRLVIDEGDAHNEQSSSLGGREFPENEFPECQGCKSREAQFVCAGCGNQWYCSRVCQVSAWDEHSEICSG